MRSKRYSCPNGCPLPPRQKPIKKYDDGTYGFAYYDFRFCPPFGNLMPYSLKKLNSFLEVYNLHPVLADALNFLTLETILKKSQDVIYMDSIWQRKVGSMNFGVTTRI